MGGDGGCVPQRADLVKTQGYDLQQKINFCTTCNTIVQVGTEAVDPRTHRRNKMHFCNLTGSKLKEPIVGDRLGNLFNKEDILALLLDKSVPQNFGHISKLKDVKDCVVKWTEDINKVSHLACPVLKSELDDGAARAVMSWHCGCILSQRSVDMEKASVKKAAGRDKSLDTSKTKFTCPNCAKVFEGSAEEVQNNLIVLAPIREELLVLIDRLPKKKEKKKRKKDAVIDNTLEDEEIEGIHQAKKRARIEMPIVNMPDIDNDTTQATKIKKSKLFDQMFSKNDSTTGITGLRDG